MAFKITLKGANQCNYTLGSKMYKIVNGQKVWGRVTSIEYPKGGTKYTCSTISKSKT